MPQIDGGLRSIFRQHLPFVHWSTIETGMTMAGVPDSHGAHAGGMFWVEYKQATSDKVKMTKTIPFQVAWHERYARAGGRSFIAIRRRLPGGLSRPGRDDLYLFNGAVARAALITNKFTEVASLLICQGGPTEWRWDFIINELVGRPIKCRTS